MPRSSRSCPGGLVYHVWNRAAGRLRLCKTDADHLALEPIMTEAQQRNSLTILDCGGMTVAFNKSYVPFVMPTLICETYGVKMKTQLILGLLVPLAIAAFAGGANADKVIQTTQMSVEDGPLRNFVVVRNEIVKPDIKLRNCDGSISACELSFDIIIREKAKADDDKVSEVVVETDRLPYGDISNWDDPEWIAVNADGRRVVAIYNQNGFCRAAVFERDDAGAFRSVNRQSWSIGKDGSVCVKCKSAVVDLSSPGEIIVAVEFANNDRCKFKFAVTQSECAWHQISGPKVEEMPSCIRNEPNKPDGLKGK
jgi:hypothetical protein